MKVALAGLGSAALRGHLPALSRLERERRVEIVASADPSASRRAVFGARHGNVALFATAAEMLERVPSDLLVVAAEPAAHADLAVLGLRHGRHVVCEKPLTLTADQHRAVVAGHRAAPDLALVPVHQYRYSPGWVGVERLARLAARGRVPFRMTVDVERDGADPSAFSPWRESLATSGGVLADHGVHFLALAWTIARDLEIVSAWRSCDERERETAAVRARCGAGELVVRTSRAGSGRRTRVDLRAGAVGFCWSDDTGTLRVGRRNLCRWSLPALSDRHHVDSLYLPFYRDVHTGLGDPGWRGNRAAEALSIDRRLIGVLADIDRYPAANGTEGETEACVA